MEVWLVIFILCTIIFFWKPGRVRNERKKLYMWKGGVNSNLYFFFLFSFFHFFYKKYGKQTFTQKKKNQPRVYQQVETKEREEGRKWKVKERIKERKKEMKRKK